MALSAPSLFLYGYQITENNRSIDFQIVAFGPEKQATLTVGYYSLGSLLLEVQRALQSVDTLHIYTATANRTISGGTQNRVTISTSGPFLSLLFFTGSRAASTAAPILGYTSTDKTGATSYISQFTSGTALVTNLAGYNYLSPDFMRKNFGSLNVSSSGVKEAVVFSVQKFWQAQFKFIPKATVVAQWTPLMTWMILQKLIEFTPEVSVSSVFYEGTLESSKGEGKGLGFSFTEQLPQFPNLYDTGLMKFRQRN